MHPQTVETLAAEGGDQGGVDVQDALGISGGEILGEDGHEARQNDDLNAVGGEDFLQLFFKSRLGAALLFQNHGGVDTGLFSPLQSVGIGVVGNHQHDLAAVEHGALGVDQCLQVGAAAGDQNCDFGFHSRITFSSFSMMVPMT